MIDLLVVGGGPAGLATAIHGARAGLDVVVAERRRGPIDKACGEGLMPHTLRHLHALAVHPLGKPIRGISYRDGDRHVDAKFKRGTGRGVRRTVLHGALIDAAVEAGVEIVRDEVREISQDGNGVRAGRWRARYLAAADGLHSPSAGRWDSSCRARDRGAGESDGTFRPRPGPTTSRCTGRRVPKPT